MQCSSCQNEVLDIDVKCPHCGAALGATGAHRMLGQVFLGTYELADVLGQGGMSVVFKARHQMTNQEVALKILPPELAAHSQVKSRFLEEAKALAALDHPNIVHLYNFGQENGSFVLAMQYVQGKTWERTILESKRLDWKTSCRITIDVLKALEYAHGRGVVHRDMKPSNVLVRESDGAATVMDFGIAKMTTSTKLTATGQTMGTVRYMSPEQVRGQEVDLRTDIYSLGATLYESLTGDTPFDGSTHFEIMTKHLSEPAKPPSSLGIEVPPMVEEALMKSLMKKASDRFENAREMRKILEAALKEGDVALVETQRLNRQMLGDVKAASKPTKPEKKSPASSVGLAPTARSATASDIGDDLRGGTAEATPVGRSRWLWITLAVLVLGGAGGTAALLLARKNGRTGYAAKTRLEGVHLTGGKLFDNRMFVETTGRVTPDDVYTAYVAALAEIESFEPKVEGQRKVLEEIVAVPESALCQPQVPMAGQAKSIIRASSIACSPTDMATTTLHDGRRQLLVSDDPATLAEHVRTGLAHAICDFQFAFLDPTAKDEDNARKNDAVCAMTKRFTQGK